MNDTARREMLSKVPEVTLYFWVIKVLCTTVGETAADFLNINLNFGLTGTSVVTGALLALALFFQFRAKQYIPTVYWVTVALISIFGTLVTDNLTDRIGVPLEISTITFGVLLALTFLVWYLKEKTLSIHSILTTPREAFYWLAILFTFALGTAAGDLMAEGLGLGYAVTGFIIAALITLFAVAWTLRLNSVLSFWVIYILTRPLGASIGDYLSQPQNHGGLGLGATWTSVLFLGAIFGIVYYLTVSKHDVIIAASKTTTDESTEHGGLWQTAVVAAALTIAGLWGYDFQQGALRASTQMTARLNGASGETSPLGDLSGFRTIAQNTLDLLNAGNQSAATTRIGDLEYAWDNAEARLKPMNRAAWTEIDRKIDTVLRELRSTHPNANGEKAALEALLQSLR